MKACIFINKKSFPCRREVFQVFWEFKYTLSKSFPMASHIFWLILCPGGQLSHFCHGHRSASRKVTAAVPRAARDLISSTCPAGELEPAKPLVPGLCLHSGLALGHQEQLGSQCDGGKIERDFPCFKCRKYCSSEQIINILLEKAWGKISATVVKRREAMEMAVGDEMVYHHEGQGGGIPARTFTVDISSFLRNLSLLRAQQHF